MIRSCKRDHMLKNSFFEFRKLVRHARWHDLNGA
jgi:hypothetical protein